MAEVATPTASVHNASVPHFPGMAQAITPADADSFAQPVAVYVGVAGDVAVRPANGGAAVVFKGAAAGSVLPCLVIGVDATSTTATDLVAVY